MEKIEGSPGKYDTRSIRANAVVSAHEKHLGITLYYLNDVIIALALIVWILSDFLEYEKKTKLLFCISENRVCVPTNDCKETISWL